MANLLIQRMLQLHEVVCHTLFKGGVYLQIFYNKLLSNTVSYTQMYNATYMRKDSNSSIGAVQ